MTEAPTNRTSSKRLSELPRAIQWALLAAAAIVLFVVWDDYLSPIGERWDRKAEAIQLQVNQVRDGGNKVANDFRTKDVSRVVTSLGPVESPNDYAAGSALLTAAVNGVLEKHGAMASHSYAWGPKGKVSRAGLTMIQPNQKVERLSGDVKFETTPKAAAAIIAELESSPDIESIETVRLTRGTAGKVKVHLVIEAWVISSETVKGAAT